VNNLPCYFDLEIYKNYFLAYFLSTDGVETTFEIFDNEQDFVTKTFIDFISSRILIGFNNKNYDDVLCKFMVTEGKTYYKVNRGMKDAPLTAMLKHESDKIIQKGVRPWVFCNLHNISTKNLNTIDIKEILIGIASLKLYGARAGSKKLQELPIDHDKILTRDEALIIKKYCRNDLEVTKQLSELIVEQIKLREVMGEEFGIDLRSKSDAQIAEAVISKYYKDHTGKELRHPDISEMPTSYKFNTPKWIKFESKELQALLRDIENDEFKINEKGSVELPPCLKDRIISYGNKSYKMGIGGLHSIDGAGYYETTNTHKLIDVDVISFYPRVILNGKFYPIHIGSVFLTIYEQIVDKRLEAKARVAEIYGLLKTDPDNIELKKELVTVINTMNALKITINGSFGKLGSKYSKFYSPDLLFHTTVSGQLTLLMLIERMENAGIPAISANTDGVVFHVEHTDEELMTSIVDQWQEDTDLQMEYTYYDKLVFRDVNNYTAFTIDGKIKTKGIFVKADLAHNPTADIVKKATIQYLGFKTPVEETIRACTDITQFLQVRTVKGGAKKNDIKLGKAIRWYYSINERARGNFVNNAIYYVDNDNKVPNSEGGMPLMDLPDELPKDLDHQWYIDSANEIIDSVNVRCIVGQNKKAKKLSDLGYAPCFMSRKGKTLPKDGFDFSRNEQIGTQTGFKAGVMQVDGQLYQCTHKAYPSGWKAFIKATGVDIIYGGVVALPESADVLKPLPQWVHSLIWDYCTKVQRGKIDQVNKGLLT